MPPDKPRHVLYLSRRYFQDPHWDQQAVYIYDTVAATKRYLTLLIADDEVLFIDDNPNRMLTSSGIIIEVRPVRTTTHTLKALWEYEMTPQQLIVTPQDQLVREVLRFRQRKMSTAVTEQPHERAKRIASSPRASRDGMVPIADIAISFNLSAREVRGLLRKGKIEKPKQGWAFPPSEVEAIKGTIKRLLEDEKR